MSETPYRGFVVFNGKKLKRKNLEDISMSEEEKISSEPAEEVTETAPVEDAPAEASANGEAAAVKSPHKGFFGKLDNYFGITKSGSNYKKEIVAGLTTFMSMVYILMLNAGVFAGAAGSYGAAYIATAIGAISGTLLMAFLAKMPLAQAPGLGVNYTVAALAASAAGMSLGNAMVFVLLDGAIFVVLTATGLRKKIFDAIPLAVRKAIGVGIGMFIAFIGFQNALVTYPQPGLQTAFAIFNVLGDTPFEVMLPAIVALVGVVAIAIMSKKNVKGAILWGILGAAVFYYILAGIGVACGNEACKAIFTSIGIENPLNAFADWGKNSAGVVLYKGFDFSAYLANNNVGQLILLLVTTALSMCMIDMFDTIGTLYGACRQGNLLDENGVPLNMNKMMLADAVATCVGALAGTSTVTTFVESSSGVAAGGKTGFTALVVALCFLLATFLSPIAQLIPSAATAAALIWVGVLMMTSVADIDWKDPATAIVAFLTIAVMAFGYSISKGIGIGMIVSVIVSVCTGKIKEVKIATWVIVVLYILMFLFGD